MVVKAAPVDGAFLLPVAIPLLKARHHRRQCARSACQVLTHWAASQGRAQGPGAWRAQHAPQGLAREERSWPALRVGAMARALAAAVLVTACLASASACRFADSFAWAQEVAHGAQGRASRV